MELTAAEQRYHPRLALFAVLTCIAFCGFCPGCGGHGTSLTQQPAVVQMPSLPPPSELVRTAAYTDEDRVRIGSSFLITVNQNVSINGSRGVYSPSWDAGGTPTTADLAYAVYAFFVEGYDLDPELYLRWCTAPAAADVWVGVADWPADAWEFHACNDSGRYPLGSMDDYISETGTLMAVVAVAGLDECLLDCLRLGPVVGAWLIETVDIMVPRTISLAIDQANMPHIGYATTYPDQGDYWTSYAKFDGYEWDIQYVADTGLLDPWTDAVPRTTYMDIDSAGRPHFVYDDALEETTEYKYHDGSSWQKIDLTALTNHVTSMALDSADLVHITYSDGGLRHAWYTGTEWLSEEVGSGLQAGRPSLALNSSDTAFIAYYDLDGDHMAMASQSDGGWEFYNVPLIEDWGNYWPSAACRSTGLPAFTFHNDSDGELWYAYFTKGVGWNTLVADSDGDVGERSSLAFDSMDHPHVSYYDHTNYDLKYAYFDGASWSVQTVEGDGIYSGEISSIAIDRYDRPCIAFKGHEPPDGHYSRLRFARRID